LYRTGIVEMIRSERRILIMTEIKIDPRSPALQRAQLIKAILFVIMLALIMVIVYNTVQLQYYQLPTDLFAAASSWTLPIALFAASVSEYVSFLRLSPRQKAVVSPHLIKFVVLQPSIPGVLWKTKQIQLDPTQIKRVSLYPIRSVINVIYPPSACLVFQASHTVEVPLMYWDAAEVKHVLREIQREFPHVERSQELIDYLNE
jgi:hypothetical protein